MGIATAITNRIRFILDECLPPVLRDSRIFMWPFFALWFRGRHIRTAMDFKRLAPSMTDAEFRDAYRNIETLAAGRATDTNANALGFVLEAIDPGAASILDVGCGGGYFLRLARKHPKFARVALYGCDQLDRSDTGDAPYVTGDVAKLPFRDRAFDVVTCFHTLEHTRDAHRAVAELRRVCGRQLVIVVPRQRYNYFTLDLHLQFFPSEEALGMLLRTRAPIRRFSDDLVAVIDVSEPADDQTDDPDAAERRR